MEIVHIEDDEESEVNLNEVISHTNKIDCELCLETCVRLYYMFPKHIVNLMKKYKELLAQIDLEKLLD